MSAPPRLPPELQAVPTRPLEEYVRARLIQFAGPFAQRIAPGLGIDVVQQAAAEAIASLPAAEVGRISLENRDLQLVFRHDCLSLGCLDTQCVLCEHNPHRRCNVNFAPKYLVNDVLKAKCEAPIRVEVIDRTTGVPLGEDIAGVHLEMCILDGNAYDAKCLEAGQEREEDLLACSILCNNKSQPLLVPSGAASNNGVQRVVVQLVRGTAQLPELHVSDSSEAILSGRKPPFRLLVQAVATGGDDIKIRHAVSEGFVVATRRTRTAGKVEIPNVDDHVSKLEHMGKETVKKLQDIRTAAVQASVEINIGVNCILKVGEFRKLALAAEADGHLRQKLQQVLKLSKEKWDEARDHAMRAVVADNRMRIWYADKASMELGLLFTCRLGNVDLDRPVGLLQKKEEQGSQTTMEATLMAQQSPQQREQVRQLQPNAVNSWWQGGHPGWAIYPVDSEQFIQNGTLDIVSVANEQMMPTSEPEDPGPGPGPATRFSSRVQRQSSGNSAGALRERGLQPLEDVSHNPSPFANEGGHGMGLAFGGGSSADLHKFTSFGSFPSIPQAGSGGLDQLLQAIPSADLHQLAGPSGAYSGSLGDSPFMRGMFGGGRDGSLGVGKLESMELPDAAAAVAMLHDMPPEASNMPPRNDMQRQNSGLESMQSIEQALGNVEHLGNAEQNFIMDKVRDDWNQQMMNQPAGTTGNAQGTPASRQ